MNGTCEDRERETISKQSADLCAEMDRVGEEIGKLEERLAPALSPPTPACDQEAKQAHGPNCILGEKLSELQRKARDQSSRLVAMCDRINL